VPCATQETMSDRKAVVKNADMSGEPLCPPFFTDEYELNPGINACLQAIGARAVWASVWASVRGDLHGVANYRY
jgi:hypothetical protein